MNGCRNYFNAPISPHHPFGTIEQRTTRPRYPSLSSSSSSFSHRDGQPSVSPAAQMCARYLISVSSLNIGKYMLMITTPTMIPTPSIMIGSTIEVRAWIEASTSSS